MNVLALFRTFLLVIVVLKLLIATVLDDIVVRYMMRPFVLRMEALTAGKVRYPPGLLFMVNHAWARRLYNFTFAGIALGFWWYLGTPAGQALLRQSH